LLEVTIASFEARLSLFEVGITLFGMTIASFETRQTLFEMRTTWLEVTIALVEIGILLFQTKTTLFPDESAINGKGLREYRGSPMTDPVTAITASTIATLAF
jgi:hypothetical protein